VGALLLTGASLLAACGGGDKKGEGGAVAEGGSAPASAPAAKPTFTAVSDQMLLDDGTEGNNWLTYGGGYNNQRYSTLTQVSKDNVKELQLAWTYQTGIPLSFETTPVVVNGVMYMTTPNSNVMALNAVTGEEMWRYEPKLGTTIICCGPNNRGVAVHNNLVFVGTLDDRLIALNNADGTVAWEVKVDDPAAGYSQTMAPLVADGKVIVGTSGAEYGIPRLHEGVQPGRRQAALDLVLDPRPGRGAQRVVRRLQGDRPVRHAAQPQHREGARRQRQVRRRVAARRRLDVDDAAYDPATKTIYASIGNPSPDLDGEIRPGDNLYTESMVAVDASTGKLKWYFQTVPHDVWDLDAVSPPILFERNGRKLVGHAGKTGWYYVVDAATGKAVMRSENFVPHENMFAQPTKAGVRMLPGANGGSEWSPTAYDPKSGRVFVLGLHQPMNYSTTSAGYKKGQLWLGSAFRAVPGEDQWGTFSAINVDDGKIAWQRRVADPMIGGALATAGGLVFVGQANGSFEAFDAEDGDVLWRHRAGAGVNSAPMTYMVNGTQYIAVAAGGNFQISAKPGDDLLVFALRDRAAASVEQYQAPGYQRGTANRLGGAEGQAGAAEQTAPKQAAPKQ
jgi:glucose dehydrogenase